MHRRQTMGPVAGVEITGVSDHPCLDQRPIVTARTPQIKMDCYYYLAKDRSESERRYGSFRGLAAKVEKRKKISK